MDIIDRINQVVPQSMLDRWTMHERLLREAAEEIGRLRAAAGGDQGGERWVSVPSTPTPEMMEAGERAWMNRNLRDPESHPIRDCYRAMVAVVVGGERGGEAASASQETADTPVI